MGVIAYYARLTATELDDLVQEPDLIRHLAQTLRTSEGSRGTAPSDRRFLSIDKAWDRIGFILDEWYFSVDIVHGESFLPGPEGWGPPGYLTPEQVHEAAEELCHFGADAFAAGLAANWPVPDNTHPRALRERAETMSYVADHHRRLSDFVHAAAQTNDAVVAWRY